MRNMKIFNTVAALVAFGALAGAADAAVTVTAGAAKYVIEYSTDAANSANSSVLFGNATGTT